MVCTDDIQRGVEQLKEVKKLGHAGAMISINPGERTYDKPEYEPFWQASSDLGIPLSIHTHTETNPRPDFSRTMLEGTTNDLMARHAIAAIVLGGVFERFPKIKLLSVENEVGWVPYFLERMDYTCSRHWAVKGWKLGIKEQPSTYVRRNCYFTFQFGKSWVPSRHLVGVDHIMWASDYPHGDSTWPNSQRIIADIFQGMPEVEKRKVIEENCAKIYGFPLL